MNLRIGALAFLSFIGFVTDSLAFGPCSNSVPKGVSYYPSLEVCGGKAAIVVSGKYAKAFSAVVRDCNNNDRDPCFPSSNSCGSNQSSPYKAQQMFYAKIKSGVNGSTSAAIHCLKESGDSAAFVLVRRMTIKLRNPVRGPQDVLKLCLKSRTSIINGVEFLAVSSGKDTGFTGYNSACKSQRYLSCNHSYQNICAKN